MFLIVSFYRFLEDQDVELEFFSTSSASEEEESHRIQHIEEKDHEDFQDTGIDTSQSEKRKYSRGSEEIITEKLSLLLDRCNISDRDAVTIVSATVEALGQDPQKLAISWSTVRLCRHKFRGKSTDY